MDVLEQKRAEAAAELAPSQAQIDALAESKLSQSHHEAAQALSLATAEFERLSVAMDALHPTVHAEEPSTLG